MKRQSETCDFAHNTTWKKRFSGWRGGLLCSIAVASGVLLLNIILALLATTVWERQNGIATAFTGDCTTAARWTTVLHLLINVLSSLLLGASNYCMQRLVAPTRNEIDSAHQRGKWLDIGILSIRNLTSIKKMRVGVWVLLALSSFPLHLVYNSIVFETVGANNVAFLTVTPEFFTDQDSWSLHDGDQYLSSLNISSADSIRQIQDQLLDGKYRDLSRFENLTGLDCAKRYQTPFITTGSGFGVPNARYRNRHGINGSESLIRASTGSGQLGGRIDYDYCISEKVASRCRIQFSTDLLSFVIAANLLKVILMVFVLWYLNEPTLVTIGDAIQSFLATPDPTTENSCLMSRYNIHELWPKTGDELQQRFQARESHWLSAISGLRWMLSLTLYISTIAIAVLLFGRLTPKGNDFGRFDPAYVIAIHLPFGERSMVPYVLLANLPQIVASLLYITYNGLYTCMLANREWTNFGTKRAPLRVTVPVPGQRSTYFLQLPYAWSVPLLVASIFLHWLISQSIFLARIAMYQDGMLSAFNDRNRDMEFRRLACTGNVFFGLGYSGKALLSAIAWSIVLIIMLLIVAGVGKYPKGLAVGGTISSVISAACHLQYEDGVADEALEGIAAKPLKWGVTIPGDQNDRVGHCSFSSRDVEFPGEECVYAGSADRNTR